MSKNQMTVYDVIGAATDEGEWVNGFFHAVVRNAKPRQGNKPSKADLCDPDSPNIKVAAAWFGGDLSDFEGATCIFDGKGMKVKSYKGKAELNIGKDALVNLLTAAPKGAAPAPAADGGGATPPRTPPKDTPKVDPTVYFHRELAKMSLGYLHCLQYAQDIQTKTPGGMPPEQFQACVSSLFIEGNKQGLFAKVPKLRDVDDKGRPVRFVPPTPPAADPAEVERKRLEAEKAAAEEARKRHEEEQRRLQEQQDEDVPF